MFLLIVADGTLFVLFPSGEIMREEKDSLGRELLPEDAVFWIHAPRSSANFPSSGEKINPEFIKTCFMMKKAAAVTNCKMQFAVAS